MDGHAITADSVVKHFRKFQPAE